MGIDVRKFFRATNPTKALSVGICEDDRKYYIDFSSVRGGQIVEDLQDRIALWSPDEPTCQLFTGHIGCGKSTELLCLKAALEQEGFHVVYFESDKDLELSDVDVGDILLTIARRVSQSLETLKLEEPTGLQNLLQGAARLLQAELEVSSCFTTPLGQVAVNSGGEFSLDMGIAKIAARVKDSPTLRDKLRGYLEPRTNGLLDAINAELLEPGIAKLKQCGKNGLVVIVDNLDRVDRSPKPWGRPQHEYLFVDRGEQLRGLKCHVVYTMPLELLFSSDFTNLTLRFAVNPPVLPMVPIRLRDGSPCQKGLYLLRQMVLARAFPNLEEGERLERIPEIFDVPATLDLLCYRSGGHVRNLLRLLNDSIQRERGLPITRNSLETVIREYRHNRVNAVTENEWQLLRQVAQEKKVAGEAGYQTLIRSLFVYEYRYKDDSWFDIDPILADAQELRS